MYPLDSSFLLEDRKCFALQLPQLDRSAYLIIMTNDRVQGLRGYASVSPGLVGPSDHPNFHPPIWCIVPFTIDSR